MKTYREMWEAGLKNGDKIRVVKSETGRWADRWPVGDEFTVENDRVVDRKGGRPGRFWSNPMVQFEKVVANGFVPLKDMPFPEVAELMKKHSEGVAIKFRDAAMARDGIWFDASAPNWDGEIQYAVAKTPEQEREDELVKMIEDLDRQLVSNYDNLRDYNEGFFLEKTFGASNREAKGALLLAAHNGVSMQFRFEDESWITLEDGKKPEFRDGTFYRTTPAHVLDLQFERAELIEKRDNAQDELNALRSPKVEVVHMDAIFSVDEADDMPEMTAPVRCTTPTHTFAVAW